MIYVTGDKHGDMGAIKKIVEEKNTSKDDILVVLGNVGLNFMGALLDEDKKREVQDMAITLFCLQGSQDKDVKVDPAYKEIEWNGGKAYVEDAYPNIIFAKDGEIYDLEGRKVLVVGGGKAVARILQIETLGRVGEFHEDEDDVASHAEASLEAVGNKVDAVFTHTCPEKYKPQTPSMPGMYGQGPAGGDDEMEKWLDTIEEKIDYKKWYCGHFHKDENKDKVRFMNNDVEELI